MKSIRIYKDDIRTHIFRSLFFTDTAILVIGIAIIAVGLYGGFNYTLGFINWGYYFSSLIVLSVFFIAVLTQRIDNQPIFKVAPRAITFNRRNREQRYSEIDNYFTDFFIQDNHIVRKNSIVRIFKVEPFDIALLNDHDREHFFIKLKQVIHVLPVPVQIIVRKEPATLEDYTPHVFSLYKSSKQSTEKLIKSYVEDLNALIETNDFMVTKYYLVISVDAHVNNSYRRLEAFKKLNDFGIRISSALSSCDISIEPLTNHELVALSQQLLR